MNKSVLEMGDAESVGMDPARIEALRSLAAGWVERGDTPSLAVLLARRGKIVLHEAFGVRHPEDKIPTLKRDSIFTVSSCTKPVTAAAIMCLVEDGLIGLNRPVIEYVPELDVPGVQWLEEARVADLLCHTSGLDDMTVAAHMAANAERAKNLPPAAAGQHPAIARRIHLAAGVKLLHQPGTAMLYSGFGFILLADIVRRASGQPFWQFVHERLFDKIGMRDSYFLLPAKLRERRVFRKPGYPGTNAAPGLHGGPNAPDYDEMDLGSVGLKTTVADLASFLQMFLDRGRAAGGRVLSPASVEAMLRQQIDPTLPCLFPYIDPATGQRMDYEFSGASYGWGVFLSGVRDRYLHNGSTASLSAFGHSGYGGSYMWADPRHDIVGVLLSTSARMYRHTLDPDMNSDLFMNAAYAALTD